ncbi:MAG: hypothetical protein JXR76_03035 [Deltaproteobacteria bacterium]|nr:hypothetical protein [Deltaproteobacteria bacterium]
MKKGMLTLALVSICLVAGSVSFADAKNYTALCCVELNDTAPEIKYEYGGNALNSSSGSNVFACPVVVEDLSSSQVNAWNVTVQRGTTSTAAWDIYLWNTDRTGWNGYYSVVTVPAATGVYHTIAGSPMGNVGSNRLMWIESTVPAGAKIASYMVDEI